MDSVIPSRLLTPVLEGIMPGLVGSDRPLWTGGLRVLRGMRHPRPEQQLIDYHGGAQSEGAAQQISFEVYRSGIRLGIFTTPQLQPRSVRCPGRMKGHGEEETYS